MEFSSISFSNNDSIYQQVTGLTPNTTYTWISWYKTANLRTTGQGYYAKIWGGNFASGLATFTAPTGTADWTRVVLTFNTGSYSSITCQVCASNFVGTVYTDNCELILGSVTMHQHAEWEMCSNRTVGRRAHSGYRRKWYTETVTPPDPPTPTSGETSRGYVIYSRASLRWCRLPNSCPARAEVTSNLSAFAMPRKIITLQFSLYALQNLGNVSVSVGDTVKRFPEA